MNSLLFLELLLKSAGYLRKQLSFPTEDANDRFAFYLWIKISVVLPLLFCCSVFGFFSLPAYINQFLQVFSQTCFKF